MPSPAARLLAGLVICASAAASTARAAVIDTTRLWDGSTGMHTFGNPNTATYGQTFNVGGTDTVLDSFSFWLNDRSRTTFAGYVMAWSGSRATGPVLYESGQRTTSGGSGMERFTFSTGGLDLSAGRTYVAFISASKFFATARAGTSTVGYVYRDVYNGGGFHYLNNGSDFARLTNTSWSNAIGGGQVDLAFRAEFSAPTPVSEPATLSLLALGIAGLAFRRRKARG